MVASTSNGIGRFLWLRTFLETPLTRERNKHLDFQALADGEIIEGGDSQKVGAFRATLAREMLWLRHSAQCSWGEHSSIFFSGEG
jgi:hypothetical protein